MQTSEAPASRRFSFVELLAKELSAGNPEVPGFPDVVMRIRRGLDDPNCNVNSVTKIIQNEPVLTAKLIRVANSAALKPASGQIKDVRNAVARLGFKLVHSATVAFAAEQMRIAHRYEAAKKQFTVIWQNSTYVAATAFILAKRCTSLNPDEALLAGLIHAIGKLYIISRAEEYPDLFENQAELDSVLTDWYVPTGQAILQGWDFPADIVTAVAAQLDADRENEGPADLGDVLFVALQLPASLSNDADLTATLERTGAALRFGLSPEDCFKKVQDAREQIDDLRKALGD
jgi:HD-like signal output (HDOD) protein